MRCLAGQNEDVLFIVSGYLKYPIIDFQIFISFIAVTWIIKHTIILNDERKKAKEQRLVWQDR